MIKEKKNKLEFTPTMIFHHNMDAYNEGFRYIINTGGSRSSKTYSILQLLVVLCLSKPDLKVSIVRQSLPALRLSTMPDLFKILEEWKLYSEALHQKTEHHYKFPNGSMIEFIGITDGQRIRGAKRDILYCNEGNEISYEEFNQLMMRTTKCCFIDRNPSEECWIDDLSINEKAKVIHSTYRDNSYLSKEQIDYIDSMINIDPNFYRIYALGLPPSGSTRIYSHFQKYNEITDPILDEVYGLDFGFAHPTAMVKCYKTQLGWFVEEVLYKVGWTSADLVSFLRSSINKELPIYCDSARPDLIEDLKRSGFKAKTSDKNVKPGIDTIRSSIIYIHQDSANLLNEYRRYSWSTRKSDGKILNEPIKMDDDLLDAMRYAIHTHKGKEPKDFKTMKFFY